MSVATNYKQVNSPIKWVGGKSRLRKYIIALLPPHTCYVEPFGGAGWVLFGKKPSDVEVLNDINHDLITFFRVLRDQPEDLIESFDWALVSRAEFNRLASLDSTHLSDLERAHRFYYLIMAAWGGELNYPRMQTSVSDGGHGNRLIGALKRLRQRLEPVHKRLQTVIIEDLDWKDCLTKYDRSEQVCMYIDPPYPGNGANYADNMRDWEDHEHLAECLAKAKCNWILSSYDNDRVREMYSQYHIVSVQAFSGMRVKKNDHKRVLNEEILVMNFSPEAVSLSAGEEPTQASLKFNSKS